MRNRGKWLVPAAVVMAGCVTQGTFEDKQAELATVAGELSACRAQARSGQEDMERARSGYQRELEACLGETETARQYAEALNERERNLRERLKAEVETRDVEISRLQDQLSVRVLDKILFRSGSAQILPAGQAVLDKLAGVLAATDDMLRVEGHTDHVPIGARLKTRYDSNWELSATRATSVVRYFEHAHRIDPLRMEAVGFSKFRPVAPGDAPEDLQRNRRVEIVLTAPRPR